MHRQMPSTRRRQSEFVAHALLTFVQYGDKNYSLRFGFLANFRPQLAPRPVPTGRARKMVQHATKISLGDQV